jgi:hypothetical protein
MLIALLKSKYRTHKTGEMAIKMPVSERYTTAPALFQPFSQSKTIRLNPRETMINTVKNTPCVSEKFIMSKLKIPDRHT